jgi:hypothetical protein
VFWEAVGKLLISGKNGFGPAPSMVCYRNDDLHLIRMMMGFHTVKLWQNEAFHFPYHMNIIMKTRFNSQMGKTEVKNTPDAV